MLIHIGNSNAVVLKLSGCCFAITACWGENVKQKERPILSSFVTEIRSR